MDERDERKRTSGDASKRFRRHQNWSCTTAPGRVWRKPTYWPRGARCIGGMTLVRALVRNLRTCPAMMQGRAPWGGVGAVGKWTAAATATSLAAAGHLS